MKELCGKYIYRIQQVRLKVGDDISILPRVIEKKLKLAKGEIGDDYKIVRESIDARKKAEIRLVYTVDFALNRPIKGKYSNLSKIEYDKPEPPKTGSESLNGRPVVIGFGPCGIFAALELASCGYRPLVIERGSAMNKRILDVENFNKNHVLDTESNMLFGEGGAGTFSDGKLTTGISDPFISQVLETFVEAGADERILYQQKPHIGTDVLRRIIVNIRNRIVSLGGEIMFDTRLEGFDIDYTGENPKLRGITVRSHRKETGGECKNGGKNGENNENLNGTNVSSVNGGSVEYEEYIATNALILAIGHSARDTFSLVRDHGINMEQKPFSIGVRIEHSQEVIDRAQYGDEDRLPPATYKVSCRTTGGRGVYSFCMCPGGEVVTCATEESGLCVNGMSNSRRDSGMANSGILCDVRTSDFLSDDVLAGVEFQRIYERKAFENGGGDFTPPSCLMKDFLEASESATSVIESMPAFASEAIREAIPVFDSKIKGFALDDAVITAVETRSSSPVRILRTAKGDDGAYMCNIDGIYPAGEGAGYAGGITSSAVDGIRVARAVIGRFGR